MFSHPSAIASLRHRLVFATFLSALLAPLVVPNAAYAGGTLLCLLPGITCRLTQDETYDSVIIGPLATIETHNHTLTIASGGLLNLSLLGTLSISDGGTVVLQGGDYTSIAGIIRLKGPGSTLKVATSTTIGGLPLDLLSGRIVGEHPDATIRIDQSAILTSRVDIQGTMTISGPGVLRNEDSVVANAEGQTLLLDSDLRLADIENALWKAYKGTLRFTHAQVGNNRLVGDVHLDGTLAHGGMLDFDASVTFDNGVNCSGFPAAGSMFQWILGTLSITSGCTFTYRCYSLSPGTVCLNPDMDTCGNDVVDPPFEVCGPYKFYCPSR